MNPKPVIIACVCAVLFVVAVYFRGKYVLEQGRVEEFTPSAVSGKKHPTIEVEPEAGDSTPPPQTGSVVSEEMEAPVANAVNAVDADDDGLVERFLPDGTPVPKHLRLPKEWIGFGTSDITHEDMELFQEIHKWLHDVLREVVANYNPNRPLAEVWPQFMAVEKQYLMQSKDADKPYYLGMGAGQVEFVYNQIWDFPEVLALTQSEGLDGPHSRVHEVEIGMLDPNWNHVELPDGRDFYVKHGYEYTFNYGYDEEAGDFGGNFTISFSPDSIHITIDLDTATDEDLERLGGWNYNFNPYTNQPIVI